MALVIAPSYTRRALVTPADMVDNLRLCRFLQNTGTAGSFIVRQNWGNVSAGNPNPFGNYVGSYPAVERIILSGGVGGAFDNQPANAAVTVVSDDAGDTSVDITIYGTTFGTNTVVAEVLATDGANGTSATTSVKTDWGLILGIEKAATTGTITVAGYRRASDHDGRTGRNVRRRGHRFAGWPGRQYPCCLRVRSVH